MTDWDDDNDWWDGFLTAFIWFSEIPSGKYGFLFWLVVLIVLIFLAY